MKLSRHSDKVLQNITITMTIINHKLKVHLVTPMNVLFKSLCG